MPWLPMPLSLKPSAATQHHFTGGSLPLMDPGYQTEVNPSKT